MRVLLKMNQQTKEINVLVSLKEARMQEMVVTMLEQNQSREAFLLLRAKAEVEAFFPVGMSPSITPAFTLVEDEVC